MSKDHQILYKGQYVPAYRFLNFSKKVTKVKYSGEILYNVLMKEHGIIEVNNLMCETLHPDNRIAKLYRNTFISEAIISEAIISEAIISEAIISEAIISEAIISEAIISEAIISEATKKSVAKHTLMY